MTLLDEIASVFPLHWVALLAIQVTAIAAAGWWLSAFFGRDPASRHAVLLVALIALFACPLASVAIYSTGWTLFQLRAAPTARIAAIPTRPQLDVPSPGSPADLEPALDSSSRRISDRAPEMESTAFPNAPDAVGYRNARQPSELAGYLAIIGVAVWVGGFLMLLARIVHGEYAISRLYRSSRHVDASPLTDIVRRVEAYYGLQGRLRVQVSDRLTTAVAAGLIRRMVFLPRSYVENLSTDELFAVLTHEAAHLIRRDAAIGTLQRIVEAVYWPHPLVHLLNGRLSRAREEVCDNHVLQHCNAESYAETLLSLVKSNVAESAPLGAFPFFSRNWRLEQRVTDLLDARRRTSTRPRRGLLFSTAAAFALMGLAFAGLRLGDHSIENLAQAQVDAAHVTLPGGAALRLGENAFYHPGFSSKNVGFLEDGTLVSSSSQSLRFWHARSGELRREELFFEGYSVQRMCVTPDGSQVAVLAVDRTTEIYNILFCDMKGQTSVSKVTWRQQFGESKEMAFTSDGNFVLVGDTAGAVTVWEVASGARNRRYHVVNGEIAGLAVSPGNLVAITTHTNQLYLWDWLAEPEAVELAAGRRWLGVAFSPDGRLLAAGLGSGQEVQLYDVETQQLVRTLHDVPQAPILAHELVFTPDGQQLAVANAVSLSNRFVAAVLLWDVQTGNLVRRFSVPGMHPRALEVSPDGRSIAAIDDTTLRVWNKETGAAVGGGKSRHDGLIRAVAFSPSSRQILTASSDHSARIWDAETGREIGKLNHETDVYAVAISPDGSTVATAGIDDTITIWELPTLQKRHSVVGPRSLGAAWELAFTPDGNNLLALLDNLRLREWEATSGNLLRDVQLRPSGLDVSETQDAGGRPDAEFHREDIMDAVSGHTITADGSKLVIAGQDAYWVFNANSAQEIARRELPFSPYAIAVSHDARRLAVGGLSRTVPSPVNPQRFISENVAELAIFDLDTGDLLWQIQLDAGRCGPLRFSHDGRWLAVVERGSNPPVLELYEVVTGTRLVTASGTDPVSSPNSIAFSPDNRRIACAQLDATVLVWDTWDMTKRGGSPER